MGYEPEQSIPGPSSITKKRTIVVADNSDVEEPRKKAKHAKKGKAKVETVEIDRHDIEKVSKWVSEAKNLIGKIESRLGKYDSVSETESTGSSE
jgi:hypothetical protein